MPDALFNIMVNTNAFLATERLIFFSGNNYFISILSRIDHPPIALSPGVIMFVYGNIVYSIEQASLDVAGRIGVLQHKICSRRINPLDTIF